MKTNRARLGASALIAAASVFLSAAMPVWAADKGPIALVAGDLTDTFFSAIKKGADDAAKDFDVDYTYVGANISGPDLAKALQAAVASNPAGIAFGDWYPASEDAIVKAAGASGIPTVAVNAAPANWFESTGALAFVGQSDYDAGALAGEILAKDGVKHVLCFNQAPGALNLQQRCNGLTDALKKAGVEVVSASMPYEDSNDPTKIVQAVQGALASDPKIDAVFSLGSQETVNAERAVEQSGNAGKIRVGGVDLSSALLDLVNQGKVEFTIDQQAYLQGYYAIAILAQEIRYGMHLVGHVSTGPAVIDKVNVARVIQINADNKGIRGAF